MAAPRRRTAILLALAIVIALVALTLLAARLVRPDAGRAPSAERGGTPRALVATLRTEPATFNRYSGLAYPTLLVTYLTQAGLVRVNRLTDQLEPWLAEGWDASADGLRYDIRLREGLRFSDGAPFTSADVEFSLAAVYDPRTASPFADTLRVNGKPLIVEVRSPSTLTIRFPAPYGPGLRLLDGLPIYPKHRLGKFLEDGTLAKAWGPTTPVGEIVGLGPFRLEGYEPGERLTFGRHPYYWRRDENGQPLPRLDRFTLEIVPDQNAELLRLQAGQTDLMQSDIRAEDYAPLKRAADKGRIRLLDVGASLDTHVLWFNLTPSASHGGRGWWVKDDFRRAISHAVDRQRLAETIYLGAAKPAWGMVGPVNRTWHSESVPRAAFDRAEAKKLLTKAGLTDRDGDGVLQDASGAPVRFTILVQKGVTEAEKGAAFLRDELAKVGIGVDVAALELSAVIGRWQKSDYDAMFHYMMMTDTDPAGNMDWWLSAGSSHMWNPGQARPATDWEARIDDLMRRQVASTDLSERRRLFTEVQTIFADHCPALVFAIPHVYVATSTRVTGITPVVQRPQILWNPEALSIR
jgi:peptide/nickel transport system substrate-binding protein